MCYIDNLRVHWERIRRARLMPAGCTKRIVLIHESILGIRRAHSDYPEAASMCHRKPAAD